MEIETTLQELYRLERFGIKLGLDNIRKLLSLLGDPQRGLRAVHVTGTNGKGSVAAYVASALHAAGLRVGLYTSPHLVRFNERIRVDGRLISDDDVLRLWRDMQPAVAALARRGRTSHPTFFEVTTAMAFEYFRERHVDVGVIEVGMGGRMDATNVIDGIVAVLTRIGLEHTDHLGKTVPRIAREKAGIIKPGAVAVTVAQDALPIIEARCRDVGARLSVVGREVIAERISQDLRGQDVRVSGRFGTLDVHTPLLGRFQVENVGLAVTTLAELRSAGVAIPDAAILEGIRSTQWPARLQVVREQPLVIVDGAHNGPAARALAESLKEILGDRKVLLVIGILDDKDLAAFAEALGPRSKRVVACRPRTHRAFPAEDVAAAFGSHAETAIVPAVADAIEAATRAGSPEDVVLVTGSIYTAGEALAHLGESP
jgi:dihydrofolate synthase/folylpolyglutamate synthase